MKFAYSLLESEVTNFSAKQAVIKVEDNDASSYMPEHVEMCAGENTCMPFPSLNNRRPLEEDRRTQDNLQYITTVFQSFELHQRYTMRITLDQNASKVSKFRLVNHNSA